MVSHPLLALDLPMKLLVWRGTDGSVFLSCNSAAFLAARHTLDAGEAETLGIVEEIARAVATA
jgi:uncharacterized protein (DUF302 family)